MAANSLHRPLNAEGAGYSPLPLPPPSGPSSPPSSSPEPPEPNRVVENAFEVQLGTVLTTCFFSPDEQYLGYGDEGKFVIVSTSTWAQHRCFNKLPPVFTGCWSPDQRFVTFGGGYLTTVNPESGEVMKKHELGTPKTQVYTCSYSPSSDFLIYGGDHFLVSLSTSGWGLHMKVDTEAKIRCLSYTADGQHVCSGGDNGSLTVVSTTTWDTEWVIQISEVALKALCFNRGFTHLTCVCTDQNEVSLKHLDTEYWEVQSVTGLHHQVKACAYSATDEFFSVGSVDGDVTTFSTGTWSTTQVFSIGASVHCCSYSARGKYLVYGGDDMKLTVTKASMGAPAHEHEEGDHICVCCYSPDGKYLTYGGDGLQLTTVETSTWSVAHQRDTEGAIRVCSYSPDGKHLIFGGFGSELLVLDTASWRTVHSLKVEPLFALSYHPDGTQISFGGEDKRLTVVETGTWEELASHNVRAHLQACCYTSRGAHLVHNGESCTLVIRCTETWSVFNRIPVDGALLSCCFSPVNEYVSLGTANGVLMTVSVATWDTVHVDRKSAEITCCCYSPDSVSLSVGSGDGFVRRVSTATWETIDTTETMGPVLACSYNPGGTHFSYASGQGNQGGVYTREVADLHPLLSGTVLAGLSTEKLLATLKVHPVAIVETVQALMTSGDTETLALVCASWPSVVAAIPSESGDAAEGVFEYFLNHRDWGSLLDVFKASYHQLGMNRSCERTLMRVSKAMPDLVPRMVSCMELTQVGTISARLDLKERASVAAGMGVPPDVVWEREREEHGIQATIQRTACAGLGNLGFLEALLDTRQKGIFWTTTMGLVVEVLWKKAQRQFFGRFALYVVFVLCVSMMIAADPSSAGMDCRYPVGSVMVEIVTLLVGSVLLLLEAVEFKYAYKNLTLWVYIGDGWNVLECLVIFLVFITVAVRLSGGAALEPGWFIDAASCVATLLTYFNLLQYLRGLTATASLVMMLFEIVIDVLPFLSILVVILVGFGFTFKVLLRNQEEFLFVTLPDAMYSTFRMGIISDIQNLDFDKTDAPGFTKCFIVIYVAIVFVLMLNLLIALITSSYERVLNNYVVTLRWERTKILVQQFRFVSMVSSTSAFAQMEAEQCWFHLLTPKALAGQQGLTEWSGQLHAIKEAIADHSRELERRVASVEKHFDVLEPRITEIWQILRGSNLKAHGGAPEDRPTMTLKQAGSRSSHAMPQTPPSPREDPPPAAASRNERLERLGRSMPQPSPPAASRVERFDRGRAQTTPPPSLRSIARGLQAASSSAGPPVDTQPRRPPGGAAQKDHHRKGSWKGRSGGHKRSRSERRTPSEHSGARGTGASASSARGPLRRLLWG